MIATLVVAALLLAVLDAYHAVIRLWMHARRRKIDAVFDQIRQEQIIVLEKALTHEIASRIACAQQAAAQQLVTGKPS